MPSERVICSVVLCDLPYTFSRFLTGNVRIMYAYVRIMYTWMLPGFITHVGLVYALSSLETVW